MMRKLFENPEAPFYFVQIAPYSYNPTTSFSLGYFVEAQFKTLSTIPGSGMAPTADVGEYATIHPCRKQEVGRRLAYQALQKTYGMKGFEADGPSYKSVEFKDGKAIVTFNVDRLGLAPRGVEFKGFEIAGADKVFYPAVAVIGAKGLSGNQVLVTCDKVSAPVAVRYCFRNWCEGDLFNAYGIPAIPFRTDDWDDVMM